MSEVPALHYRAFGLGVRSRLPLPELLPAEPGAAVDVEIGFGEVPEELPGVLKRGVRFQAAANALRLQVDGVATYLIEAGRRITIARNPGAEDDDVRVFLLGSVFGAILHQRQDLVLHGSAIERNGEAVVFLGYSGVGKSTLASAFRQRGHAVLTDDLCVVRPDAGGRILAYPGFPQTKLWPDSLKALDISPEGLRRIRNKLEKRAVPLEADFASAAYPLRKLYLLQPSAKDELALVPVTGPLKFALVKTHTFRFGFLAGTEGRKGHFQAAMPLAQRVPFAIAVRPRKAFRLNELVELLAADFGA